MYNDIFVNEDISKPENRINIALFHLQMNSSFHTWFFKKLNLDSTSILYPVKNVKGNRPDYIIRDKEGVKIGYIEVECGIDITQVEKFKKLHETENTHVYSVFGLKKDNPDISLEEIKEFLESNDMEFITPQEKISVKYLIELINNTIYCFRDNKRRPVSNDFIKSTPFLNDLFERLSNIAVSDTNRPQPNKIYYDTNKPKGFSLQVFSIKGNGQKISLLNISGGRPYIVFQSEKKYRDYLVHKPKDLIDDWIKFIIKDLGYPINLIKDNGKQCVPIDKVHSKIDELVELIKKLV